MPKSPFLTIPDELLIVAEALELHLSSLGYKVDREPHELGFPFTPALRARRQSTLLIIEVLSVIDITRLNQWSAYCRSCSSDARIAFATPTMEKFNSEILKMLVDNRVGHYVVEKRFVTEHTAAQDLSVNISWPEMGKFSARLRSVLGSAKEKFDKGNWKEAFEECCEIFETRARAHLASGLSSGRIVVLDSKGNPKNLTRKVVRKAPIGELAKLYSNIRNKNRKDALIEKVLEQIKSDRNEFIHRRRHKRTDTVLRKNAGRHIWTVVMTLKDIE